MLKKNTFIIRQNLNIHLIFKISWGDIFLPNNLNLNLYLKIYITIIKSKKKLVEISLIHDVQCVYNTFSDFFLHISLFHVIWLNALMWCTTHILSFVSLTMLLFLSFYVFFYLNSFITITLFYRISYLYLVHIHICMWLYTIHIRHMYTHLYFYIYL